MSAQINLYHPRFLKQNDPLSLGNVAIAALVLYLLLAAAGVWSWDEAEARKAAATTAEAQLKAAKERLEAITKAAALRKPNAQLIAELENAESVLRRRGDIARLLESGAVGSTAGFAGYLRGLARQVPEGLWLTGLKIDSGGNDMEIRGKMLNPAALPDYIRRLGTEKAFQGRSFAELTMTRPESAPLVRPPAQGSVAAVPGSAPTAVPAPVSQPVDFALMPKLVESREAGK